VLRAATVPRSTEILPLGFDWVITFLHSLRGAVGVLPGCAPFCVKAVSPGAQSGFSERTPAAPRFALRPPASVGAP